jgi:hypothetical protein
VVSQLVAASPVGMADVLISFCYHLFILDDANYNVSQMLDILSRSPVLSF